MSYTEPESLSDWQVTGRKCESQKGQAILRESPKSADGQKLISRDRRNRVWPRGSSVFSFPPFFSHREFWHIPSALGHPIFAVSLSRLEFCQLSSGISGRKILEIRTERTWKLVRKSFFSPLSPPRDSLGTLKRGEILTPFLPLSLFNRWIVKFHLGFKKGLTPSLRPRPVDLNRPISRYREVCLRRENDCGERRDFVCAGGPPKKKKNGWGKI